MRRRTVIVGAIAAALLGYWSWRAWWPSDEQRIRRRIEALAADVNESTTGGLGAVARAAKIGSYFTEDVAVDLGKGSPAIQGRETLIGMAARLQPRTAAFRLRLVDLQIAVADAGTAQVNLTAAFERRGASEESIDARELLLDLVERDGEWRISHIRTVEAFR